MSEDAQASGRSRPAVGGNRWWFGCGLVALGAVLWAEGPFRAFYAAVPVVLGLALLILTRLQPAQLDRWVPRVPAERRIELGLLLLIVGGALRITYYLAFFVYAAGVWLLIKEARRTGDAEQIDPSQAWQGWRKKVLAVSVLLAGLNLGGEWQATFSSTSQYGSGDYIYNSTYTDLARSGYATGRAQWVAIALLPAILWLLLKPRSRPSWYRYVPAASIAAAAALTLWAAIDDYRFVQELHDISGSYPRFQASGPTWFLLLIAPGAAIAAWYAVKGTDDPKPREQEASEK